MQFFLQTTVALVITAMAVAYVIWYLWRSMVTRKSGCGTCNTHCPSAEEDQGKRKTLVAIEYLDQQDE